MKLIRSAAGLLLAAALALSMSSCLIVINGGGDPEDTTSASGTQSPETDNGSVTTARQDDAVTPENKAKNELSRLVKADMNGKTVIIMTCDSALPVSTDSLEEINAVRWQTINDVAGYYNAKILVSKEKEYTMRKNMLDAAASGLYYADILSIYSASLGDYYADGLLERLDRLPFISFSEDYYDPADPYSVAGSVYALSGKVTREYDNYSCIFLNQDLARDPESMFSLVDAGKWTLDSMNSAVKDFTGPDGTLAFAYDDAANESVILYAGSGERFISYADGEYSVYSPSGNCENIIGILREMMLSENTGNMEPDPEDQEPHGSPLYLFREGQTLFYRGFLLYSKHICNMPFSFSVLPCPKYTDDQDSYYSWMLKASVLAVPAGSAGISDTARIIEALNVRAGDIVKEYSIEQFLDYYARDGRSVDMYETVVGSRPYADMAFTFGDRYAELGEVVYKVIPDAVTGSASLYDSHFLYYIRCKNTLDIRLGN